MKTNLFISSNALTTIISSIIIKEKFPNDKNILLVVCNHIELKFLQSMYFVAKQLNCFSNILMFNDFSPNIKMNTHVNINDIKAFNFVQFEQQTQAFSFDNIFTTHFYIHSKVIIENYKYADIHLMENGTSSYLFSLLDKEIGPRIKGCYSFNYFGLFVPQVTLDYPYIKNIFIDKQKVKDIYEKLSDTVNIPVAPNSVLFLAHNLAMIPDYINSKDEFGEYEKIIRKLLDKGYTIYFKDHPKTPYFYYEQANRINSERVIKISDSIPIELLIPKIKPKAVVSLFSSSLLTAAHFFDIPAYTFKIKEDLEKIPSFKISYAMMLSYIPQIEEFGKKAPISNIPLLEHPLFQLCTINCLKVRFSKENFTTIHKHMKDFDYSDFEHLSIPKKLYDVFKKGSYYNYLNYHFNYNIKPNHKTDSQFKILKRYITFMINNLAKK